MCHNAYFKILGVDSMKPWGVLHGLCGFRKLKEKRQGKLLKIVPTDTDENSNKKVGILHWFSRWLKIAPSDTRVDNDTVSQDPDLETDLELGKRIADLEEFNRFLRSDVIDISSLEAFKKQKERQQDTIDNSP